MWRATVWRGGFPSSNELHGQISDSGRYTTDKTPTAWCSVYVPGIQIKRNQPPNLRETGHIHRQINNARGVNGEWQRCENSTPGGEGEFYLSHLGLGLRHLENTCVKWPHAVLYNQEFTWTSWDIINIFSIIYLL